MVFFVFHIGLLVTPVFLLAHNILLEERWGFSLCTLPESVADVLTVAMIIAAVCLVSTHRPLRSQDSHNII